MDLHLTVDSYFEYFLTVFGWVIGNNIWELMIDTGLFAAPFVAHIISSFLKVREQGDDEGNKGRLLIAWLENKIYLSIIIMMMCCVPLFNVSFSTLKFDTARMKECKTIVLAPEQTGLGNLKTELNGQSASLPLWWAFTYATSKGLTHGAIASIPCKPDLRQIRFEVQSTQIKDPFLRKEVSDFVQECFLPARTKLNNFGTMTAFDDAQADDISWIGSHILVNAPGLYDSFYAKSPNKHFPWNPNKRQRDENMPRDLGGGFPQCKEWWVTDDVGLRARLANHFKSDVRRQIDQTYSGLKPNDYIDSLIRQLIKQSDINVSGGKVYTGYGFSRISQTGGADTGNVIADGFSNAVGAFRNLIGIGASRIGSAVASPGFDMMKQSLSMVQGFILFSLAVAMPLIIVFSGYSIKAMMTVTFSWFAVIFLSFWWEIAHWIDTSLIEALYDSNSHSSGGFDFIWNTADDGILNIVTNVLYLLLPGLWLAMLSWAGIKAGNGINSAIGDGGKSSQSTTNKGVDTVKSAAR